MEWDMTMSSTKEHSGSTPTIHFTDGIVLLQELLDWIFALKMFLLYYIVSTMVIISQTNLYPGFIFIHIIFAYFITKIYDWMELTFVDRVVRNSNLWRWSTDIYTCYIEKDYLHCILDLNQTRVIGRDVSTLFENTMFKTMVILFIGLCLYCFGICIECMKWYLGYKHTYISDQFAYIFFFDLIVTMSLVKVIGWKEILVVGGRIIAFPFMKIMPLPSRQDKEQTYTDCSYINNKQVIKKLTPYQGRKKCYGDFKCPVCWQCWNSYNSFANTPEICKNCGSSIYPYRQRPLTGPYPLIV